MKIIIRYFDKLEDRIRGHLSRRPIFYGIVGGIGLVLFWRGVWHTADMIALVVWAGQVPSLLTLMDGPISFFIGTAILLMTGLFVSSFIGTRILVSGLRGEKKISEKTESEIREEETELTNIQQELKHIEAEIEEIDRHTRPKG